MAKSYTWQAPLAQPTGFTATATAGGTLPIGTTYYYKIIPASAEVVADEQNQTVLWGQASAEMSATTDASNRTISLSWTAVSGAGAYYIVRTTTSGNYNTTARMHRISDNSGNYPATTATSATDNGSRQFGTTNLFMAAFTTHPNLPGGLQPMVNYGGMLNIEGGDSGDPITFKNIYDWMVINVASYANYVYYDGYTFACLFGINFQGTGLTYFKDINKLIVMTKKIRFSSTVSGSVIQFGELNTSNGQPWNGCNFYHIGSRVAISSHGTNSYIYDCKMTSSRNDSYWTQGQNNIVGPNYWDLEAVTDARQISIQNFTISRTSSNDFKKDISYFVNTLETNGAAQRLLFRLNVLQGYQAGFGVNGIYRFDQCTAYGTDAQLQIGARNNIGTVQTLNFVDCLFPNTTHAEKLPTYYGWTGTSDNAEVYLCYSFRFVVLKNGVPLQGVLVNITKGDGAAAVDYDGTSLAGLTTNVNGRAYREKITISAITSTTITDSTKSWTTNQWEGRNVRLDATGEIYKVRSNTATVLTLAETMLNVPATGTRAGIIIELRRLRAVHTPAGGATATTITDYGPFELNVLNAGYARHTSNLEVNEPTNLRLTLRKKNSIGDSYWG